MSKRKDRSRSTKLSCSVKTWFGSVVVAGAAGDTGYGGLARFGVKVSKESVCKCIYSDHAQMSVATIFLSVDSVCSYIDSTNATPLTLLYIL